MARFSLIVPFVGNLSSFEDTLASVLRYRPEHAQVLVVHGGDYEDRYGLGREVDCVEIHSNAADPLIELFNAGVREARGQWLGFLRPGIQLSENWERGIDMAFANAEVASVSPLIVSNTDSRQRVAAGVNLGPGYTRLLEGDQVTTSRRVYQPLGPISWGAFYRRSILVALDECDVDLGSNYFDLDLALSFSALGFSNVSRPDCVLTCAPAEAEALWQEASQPHGCSAERARTRYGSTITAPPSLSRLSAAIKDLLAWPWRWQNLTHARQRQEASRYQLVDAHYRQLLMLLREQRTRLVSPGLHARVAAHQRSGSVSQRKAA